MQRRWIIAVLTIVAALAFAACGGGGDDSDDASSQTAAASEQAAESEQADSDGDADDDAGSAINLLDSDCAFVLGGPDLADAAQGLEGDFAEVTDAWQALTDRAPDAIQDDMQVMTDTFRQMAEILEGIDLTDPQALTDPDNQEKLLELNEVLDGDAFSDASEGVEAWFEENCTG